MPNDLTMGFLGVYVHVPFCKSRCGYCDFYSVLPGPANDPDVVVDCLIRELDVRRPRRPRGSCTLFIGGGTPTVLSERNLSRLLAAVREAVPTPPDEFTVEANPESLTASKATVLRSHGVDRLSLGAQSFRPEELAALDRIHTPDDTVRAVETARARGIERISLDLIFGIPGQTLASWTQSLEQAISLGVEHLSCYGLTYEPGTRLARQLEGGRVARCDNELEADLYLLAIDALTSAGFEHYEISNFARPGGRCEHNMVYWRNEPYLGVGPSAASYVDGRRYRNVADLHEYVRLIEQTGRAEADSECLTGNALAAESLMLGLRLIEGIDLRTFRERTGVDLTSAAPEALRRFAEQDLLLVSIGRVALTREGLLVADTIIADMMAELQQG